MAAINPMLVLGLVPLFDRAILPCMRRLPWSWAQPTALRRMSVGMWLAVVAFALSGLVQSWIDSEGDGRVSIAWQVLQFVVLTCSEILVSTTGLEWCYTQAPPRMKGTVLALYYFAVSVGDMMAGVTYDALGSVLTPLQLIWLFSGFIALAAAAFCLVAWRYTPSNYDGGGGGNSSSSSSSSSGGGGGGGVGAEPAAAAVGGGLPPLTSGACKAGDEAGEEVELAAPRRGGAGGAQGAL
jgi:uncharacterized membrane protein YgcG